MPRADPFPETYFEIKTDDRERGTEQDRETEKRKIYYLPIRRGTETLNRLKSPVFMDKLWIIIIQYQDKHSLLLYNLASRGNIKSLVLL